MGIACFPLDDVRTNLHKVLRLKLSPASKPLPFPQAGTAYALCEKENPQAFLAVFSAEGMRNTDDKTAIIGYYEAVSERDGHELLGHVEEELKQQGIATIIGPMNQNTFGQYRFALPKQPDDKDFSPHTFFLDVVNHESYPSHFTNFGFTPISHYESRVSYELHKRHHRRYEILNTMQKNGISLEKLQLMQFDETIKEIFDLSLQGFSKNKFYAPISFEYFLNLYKGIQTIIDEDFFLLLRDKQGKLMGFIFAYQDLLAQEKRVVLKSMAIDESARGMGLGLFLMDEIQRIAHEKNFLMAIHALMFASNTTQGISEGALSSIPFRRYALYKKSV